jgi:hypothetical protein
MQSRILENGNLEVTVDYVLRGISGRRRIIAPGSPMDGCEPLVLHVARAFRWQKCIDEGRFANTVEMAKELGIDQGVIARTIRLATLSPAIIHRILMGDIPKSLTVAALRNAIPESWREQERLFLGI